MPVNDDEELREILGMKNVAVVGCSTSPAKDAHRIPKYLLDHGYNVIPVNPHADEVLGREAYDSIRDVEEDIDIVDVFRPSEEVEGIVEAALEVRPQAIWTQLGIRDRKATDRAEEAGIRVVEDRCMKVEHQRLMT